MNQDPVRAIAEAVLYEGYLLWPYRRSALKNQQRFTFGGVYPQACAREHGDRWRVRMECVLEARRDATIEVCLRWLHLVERHPLRRERGAWRPVDELRVSGERYVAWEEATEREVSIPGATLGDLAEEDRRLAVEIPAGEELQQLAPDAALRRGWQALEGTLEVSAAWVGERVARLSIRFANTSGWPGRERQRALGRTFLSAHVAARCSDQAFLSSTDPPEELREEVDRCGNEGLWPVLAGEEGQRDTMLGSPIILSDYPSVAPESPGNLFDGGEIDALLIHSIRGLTEQEREEIRATDPRAREILDRSLALSPEEMLRLYGAVREMRPVEG